jgi:hypothetical protein
MPAKLGGIIISPVASHARSGNLSLSARVMARLEALACANRFR